MPDTGWFFLGLGTLPVLALATYSVAAVIDWWEHHVFVVRRADEAAILDRRFWRQGPKIVGVNPFGRWVLFARLPQRICRRWEMAPIKREPITATIRRRNREQAAPS